MEPPVVFDDIPLVTEPPPALALPRALLYATSAGLGGPGLNLTSYQSAVAAYRAGILKRAIAYSNQQKEIPRRLVRSLAAHPVRLLGSLGSTRYYGAKKRYLSWIAARELERGRYDCFHSWSGDCATALLEARQKGVPTLLEIPTWHRNKGQVKPFETKSERELRARRGWRAWLERLPPSRQRILLEYELADIILVPSTFAARTFLAAGIPEEKLHYVGRGVDLETFTPAESPPPLFRAIFAGALIHRKGVHHLLKAWKALNLPDAELWLAGQVHPEIEPVLDELMIDSVKVLGFTGSLPNLLRQASVFVFPSECEGFAKATCEAAATGLPLIATQESGDAVVDGVTGWVIPPNNPDAIAERLLYAYHHRDQLLELGRAARARMEQHFSWPHFHQRLLHGYARAKALWR